MNDTTDLFFARRERDLLRAAAELRRGQALTFFSPHEKQKAFFRAAFYHYRYARTGNRFGKSEMGAAEDVAFALGYRPWIDEDVTLRSFGETDCPEEWLDVPLRTAGIPPFPTKGLIVTTDWDKTKEVFTELEGEQKGKLIKYIPSDCVGPMTKNHSGKIDLLKVRHVSGGWSTIALDTVVSYKQNPLGQESSSWDWIHIDEPIPQGMWKAMSRGLVDRGGRAWFTCTPLSEPWIDEKFVPNVQDQLQANADSVGNSDDSVSSWMMTGTMDDNPHNRLVDIERFMNDLTDDEREARRKGIPTSYAGIVYKEFDWNVHVRTEPPLGWVSWDRPPADHCIRFAIDYHFRKNDAVLFIATCPQGVSYIYAELWEQMLLDEEVKRIKDILGTHTPQPGLVDPLASTPGKVTEVTAMDEYRRLGLAILPATKDPVNGIRGVKAHLKSRDKHGRPTLVFNAALRRTLFEISRGFIWDGEENRPIKKNDDMMENLYRLCLDGLPYIEPATDYEYTIIKERPITSNIIAFDEFHSSGGFDEFDTDSETNRKADKRRAYAGRYRA